MPTTLTTWSISDFAVHINPNGIQENTTITQLANGNILISWTDFDDTPGQAGGTATGSDVIGRIVDPLGNPVGNEIRLNNNFNADDEQNADITGLSDGGFMVVYEDNGADNNLGIDVFNAAGVLAESSILLDDLAGGAIPYSPVVASATLTSVMTAYIVNNNDGSVAIPDDDSEQVFIRPYDPGTDTFLAPISVFSGLAASGENIGGISLTALANDTFALVISNRNTGDDTIALRIHDAAGSELFAQEISPGVEIGAVHCVGLTGGNVAIVFENLTSGTIIQAVYSSTGVVVRSSFQVSDLNGSQIAPAVCALADGGFVVVWDDNANSDIRGQRYDSAGVAVGVEFIVDGIGTQSKPSVIGLADGRFQVSWSEDGNIRSEIFDPRDVPNNPAVYTPDDQVIGTVGDDFIQTNADRSYGYSGNDSMVDGVGDNSMFGGSGNDILQTFAVSAADFADGGDGIDTIRGLTSVNGVVYNLQTQQLINGATIQSILSIENAIGGFGDESFVGSAIGNALSGQAGNDSLEGRDGADSLDGGNGNDTLTGGVGADQLVGGNGTDLAVYWDSVAGVRADMSNAASNTGIAAGDTYNSIENLAGTNANDALVGEGGANYILGFNGNDAIEGRSGNDTLDGGAGNDTLLGGVGADSLIGGVGTADLAAYWDSATGVRVDLQVTANNTGIAVGDTFSGIENLAGTNLNDTLNGDAQANRIIGFNGADVIESRAGNDTLEGGDGNDSLGGGLGADSLMGGNGRDLAYFWDSTAGGVTARLDILGGNTGFATGDVFNGIEDIAGTNFADVLVGDATGNTLLGSGGNDTLFGNAGNDTLQGGAGNDSIYGMAGNDLLAGEAGQDSFVFEGSMGPTNIDRIIDFSSVDDRIVLENALFTTLANGSLVANQVAFGASATLTTERVVYNQATGQLFYDADGVGGTAQVQIATLNSGTALVLADFFVN